MSRWVLVTGGAVRLGREFCLSFSRAGWAVICHYRSSKDDAEKLVKDIRANGCKATAISGDLDSASDARNIFDCAVKSADGPLQCIVNNASLFEPDGGEDFTEAKMLSQLRTNLIVPLTFGRLLHAHGVREALTHVASLIHVLDQKVYNLNPDYFSYTLSKLALERAVAQQAQALAPWVRVNAVAPGLLYPSGPQTLENFALASRVNLLQRPIDPVHVAEAATFLAGNPSIVGSSLAVDNGQHLVPVPRDIMFVVDKFLKDLRDD